MNKIKNSHFNVQKGGDSQHSTIPGEAILATPLQVEVHDFEKAFKIFRAMVQKERVIVNFKQRQRYEKPSEKKRRKKSENNKKYYDLENFNKKEKI